MTLAFEDAEFTLNVELNCWICQSWYMDLSNLLLDKWWFKKRLNFFVMSPLLTDIDHLTRLEEEPIDISSEISGNQLELEIIPAGRQRSQVEQEVADESALLPPIKTKCPIVIENSGFIEIPSLHF